MEKIYKPNKFQIVSFTFLLSFTLSVTAEIDIPIKTLKNIASIPDVKPILLEERVRLRCPNNERPKYDRCPSGQGRWLNEVAILEVDVGVELNWDLTGLDKMPPVPESFDCGTGGQMKSWMAQVDKLFFAQCGSAYFFAKDGSKEILHLQMPGNLDLYVGMSQYSLSANAKRISYTMYTRDRSADKLYQNLMVQEAVGSPPTVIATGYTNYISSLNPDGSLVAYSIGASVKIAKLSGEVVSDIQSPNAMFGPSLNRIQELRWSPDGSKLAARISGSVYWLNISDPIFNAVVHDKSITDVANIAWSPNGEELAFRSTFEGEKICSYGPQFSGGVIVFQTCATGYRLYTVDIATGKTKRLKASTEYRPGALFWIQ